MTPAEINLAVAQKLGYTHLRNELGHLALTRELYGTCFVSGTREIIPDYCRSIRAAWEIVEWISERLDPSGGDKSNHSDGRMRFVGNGFRLEHHTENIDGKWGCILPEVVTAPPYEEMNDDIQAEADTAPMAICLAFLKLTEGQ